VLGLKSKNFADFHKAADILKIICNKFSEKTEKIIPFYSLRREYPILGVKSYSTIAAYRPIENSITTINP
jgi:hypothetical protein